MISDGKVTSLLSKAIGAGEATQFTKQVTQLSPSIQSIYTAQIFVSKLPLSPFSLLTKQTHLKNGIVFSLSVCSSTVVAVEFLDDAGRLVWRGSNMADDSWFIINMELASWWRLDGCDCGDGSIFTFIFCIGMGDAIETTNMLAPTLREHKWEMRKVGGKIEKSKDTNSASTWSAESRRLVDRMRSTECSWIYWRCRRGRVLSFGRTRVRVPRVLPFDIWNHTVYIFVCV